MCNSTATVLPRFNLALCTKSIYVDLCRFCAKMNNFQRKWAFFSKLYKLICGIDGEKSASFEMGG